MVVVAAAIVRNGRLLAARRCAPSRLRGGWELPGGKVEPGEDDVDALVRECREELGVDVAVGLRLGDDWPIPVTVGRPAVLRVWFARVEAGDPVPLLDHDQLRWLTADELDSVPWLPADLPVVSAIAKHLRRGAA